jgi:hypothetical protein
MERLSKQIDVFEPIKMNDNFQHGPKRHDPELSAGFSM